MNFYLALTIYYKTVTWCEGVRLRACTEYVCYRRLCNALMLNALRKAVFRLVKDGLSPCG